MGGMIRLIVFGFIILTVIYVVLSLYSRSVRRGKLRQEWEDEGMEVSGRGWARISCSTSTSR